MRLLNFLFICIFLGLVSHASAQNIGVNTTDPDPSAALNISSVNTGLLVARLSSTQRIVISDPATGLMVFDSTSQSFWYRDTTKWLELSGSVGVKSINGSSSFVPYNINPRKYMWELTGHPTLTSIEIPLDIVTKLCSDEDGCKMTLIMSEYSAGTPESISYDGRFYYLATGATRRWSSSSGTSFNTTTGIDGSNSVQHIAILANNVYFSDAEIFPGSGGLIDNRLGLHFFKANNLSPTTVARLVLED